MSEMRAIEPRWDLKTDAELASALVTAWEIADHFASSVNCRDKALNRAMAIRAEMKRREWEKTP